MQERPALVIDSLNLFTRAFCAYPSVNSDGEQFGGCVGFLKTLRRLVDEIQPSAIYVAWEGGGSTRRRAIFSEYKLGRRPEKLNRFYEDDIPESEENRQKQLLSLVQLLKHVPVCQLYASDCEADDVIAHLVCGPLKGKNVVIGSSDKDLYQLLNDDVKMYSFHRKTFVTSQTVLQDFRVASSNFAVAKALCGDVGDNVPGVKGVGFKTVAKLFPFLGSSEPVVLQDVFDYCQAHRDESKALKKILENEDLVRRSWRLVFLNGNMLSASQAVKVDSVVASFVPKSDRVKFTHSLLKCGINDFDVASFFQTFNCVVR